MPPRRTGLPNSQKLTVYLIKDGVFEDTDIVKDAGLLDAVSVGPEENAVGTLYIKPTPGRPPKWAGFFAGHTATPMPSLVNKSTAAVLVVRQAGRTFALTYGFGYHLLVPGAWEERFGLIVTLNSIIIGKVKSVDVQSFDTISSHRRTQASREGSFSDFGLDVERDLLRSAVGTPDDNTLGTRMSGSDALHVHVPVEVTNLPAQLERYLEKYRDNSYKERYPWIDQLAEIRDSARIAELDEALVAKLRERDTSRMWFAIPEIIEWKDVDGFRYGGEPRSTRHTDIRIEDFLRTLGNDEVISPALLFSKRVIAVAASADVDTYAWTAYQCIYAEIERGSDIFFLSSGKWYRVAQAFATDVNASVNSLTVRRSFLPNYDDADEGAYNERVARENASFALMDRKLIKLAGVSSIEYCDLFSDAKHIIHVKRYGSSSVLSHLFSQGVVSGTLFVTEQDFRTKVIAKLPTSHQPLIPSTRPAPQAFEVVFAVVTDSSKDIIDALPFFSRINLKAAAQTLLGYEYKVSITKIGIV